ncbi:unnamed protein product [Soboliphyme baturini]|uniref:Ferritin n=1 Tax=Soboliphyme baturini TaxID=241478 RepID=A0A183ID05_9BILA|nr:unnamed protein product [Soboliphyme baturini]
MSVQAEGNVSVIRQNFHLESEAGINRQINLELHASYVYLAMATYFDRDDVALPGFVKFFMKSSDDEREHAKKFIKYQNKRGGRVVMHKIEQPPKDTWASCVEAMEDALALERMVNQSLMDLHKIASSHEDANMCDFLETEYLAEQVESMKQIAGYITNLKRAGRGLGEYCFDRETLNAE